MVTKVELKEVMSWLGCGWVDCGGFSRTWAMAEGEDRRLWAW